MFPYAVGFSVIFRYKNFCRSWREARYMGAQNGQRFLIPGRVSRFSQLRNSYSYLGILVSEQISWLKIYIMNSRNLKAQPHALRVFQDFQVFQKPPKWSSPMDLTTLNWLLTGTSPYQMRLRVPGVLYAIGAFLCGPIVVLFQITDFHVFLTSCIFLSSYIDVHYQRTEFW